MRGMATRTRRRLVYPVLAALALGVTAGSVSADAANGNGVPLPSRATASPFDDADVRVGEVAFSNQYGHAFICVWAEVANPLGENERMITTESGCSESIHHRFDPVNWTAWADGTFVTYRRTTRQQLVSGEWTTTSVSRDRARAAVDLRWRATGPVVVEAHVGEPRICYRFPLALCGGVYVAPVERDAEVSGSIHFGGIGRTVPIPDGHAGTMSVG